MASIHDSIEGGIWPPEVAVGKDEDDGSYDAARVVFIPKEAHRHLLLLNYIWPMTSRLYTHFQKHHRHRQNSFPHFVIVVVVVEATR